MKYHTVSTSKSGHGAIFTNSQDAREYHRNHPGSIYQVFDRMPPRIPPVGVSSRAETAVIKKPAEPSEIINIYTDGSALNNPGPGGYGVILIMDGETHEFSQGYLHTTNNRMEMMAVITALEEIEGDDMNRPIVVHSDSQYTINGITKGWAKNWRKRGWIKSDGKPALNPDLWKQMLEITERLPKLTFQWVKGHAGDVFNERADELANGAAQDLSGDEMLVDEGYIR